MARQRIVNPWIQGSIPWSPATVAASRAVLGILGVERPGQPLHLPPITRQSVGRSMDLHGIPAVDGERTESRIDRHSSFTCKTMAVPMCNMGLNGGAIQGESA